MASFYSTLRTSVMALFSIGTTSPAPPEEETATLEELRASMGALAASCPGDAATSLGRRIRFAADVQALWFMRSELMGLLARNVGEAAAREKLSTLSVSFKGLLPPGLQSRASFLDSGGHGTWNEPMGK